MCHRPTARHKKTKNDNNKNNKAIIRAGRTAFAAKNCNLNMIDRLPTVKVNGREHLHIIWNKNLTINNNNASTRLFFLKVIRAEKRNSQIGLSPQFKAIKAT
jgi:hypothetical protein